MVISRLPSLTVLFIFYPLFCYSQTLVNDLNHIYTKMTVQEAYASAQHKNTNKTKVENELKLFAYSSIKFYQVFISSQDNSVCNFKPSCSAFSQSALQSTDLLEGLFLTSDRLQRCNGSAYFNSKYTFNYSTNRFTDSVQTYLKL